MPAADPRARLEAFAADWQQRRGAHEAAGERLSAERDAAIREAYAAGVTQPEIAVILGLSQQLVSRILRARG